MSGALDASSRELALQLLARFGKDVTYTHVGEPAYDVATSGYAGSETSQTVAVYIDSPNAKELQAGCVASDQIALLAAKGLTAEPGPNDRMTIDGVAHTVAPVSKVWSGAEVALYRLKVVKS